MVFLLSRSQWKTRKALASDVKVHRTRALQNHLGGKEGRLLLPRTSFFLFFCKLTELCPCLLKLSQHHSLGPRWHPGQNRSTTGSRVLKSSQQTDYRNPADVPASQAQVILQPTCPTCRSKAFQLEMQGLTVHMYVCIAPTHNSYPP